MTTPAETYANSHPPDLIFPDDGEWVARVKRDGCMEFNPKHFCWSVGLSLMEARHLAAWIDSTYGRVGIG